MFKSKSFLHQKYVIERLSISQIAKENFSARSTIKNALEQNGIPIRVDAKGGEGSKGQIGYGLKLQHGRLVEHKAEMAIIHRMNRLRSQGYSYRKIAMILNSMGVPTKTKKSDWKAATMMKILNQSRAIEEGETKNCSKTF